MQRFSSSKKLIANVANFIQIKPFYPLISRVKEDALFYGWGRRKSGLKAEILTKKFKGKALFLEDGFIRSLGLGIENSPTCSLVVDDLGIYYDATQPSRLEKILNEYDFQSDPALIQKAKRGIELIKELELSKYNENLPLPKDFFKEQGPRILIITQTANDASLKYGCAGDFSTLQMINEALAENENAAIYLKIHPDTLSGKKKSDFELKNLPQKVQIISENYNPIALLKHFDKVYTKSSAMGFEALILGKKCVCYGLPFYAGWGVSIDRQKIKRRVAKRSVEEIFVAAYLLYTQYFNIYTNEKSDLFSVLCSLHKMREIHRLNANRLFFYNFTLWKRPFIKPFFRAKNNEIIFINSLKEARRFSFSQNDKLLVWSALIKDEELRAIFGKDIQIFRVEDGFIRSLTLGSDLTAPASLIVDSKGLFIDPSKPSDLEQILQNTNFSEQILQRAKNAISLIKTHKISKYNEQKHLKLAKKAKKNQKIILIAAQVEDDASMILGGFGLSTLEFIKRVREQNPNAYIIFKFHPDVLSGNRKGLKDRNLILQYCDEIVEKASVYSCFELADELHTITSTVGFEALIYGLRVHTYGLPFYAGWGLSVDEKRCERRSRKLSPEELVAGALLLYPRYIDLKDKNLCEFELCFDTILNLQQRYFSSKAFQCRLWLRNVVLRGLRRMYERLFKR